MQFKYVEIPGAVINEETVIEHIGSIAIVHLVSDQIGQAHLPVTHFRKWQEKPALPLIAGVIDNHSISAAIVAGPRRRRSHPSSDCRAKPPGAGSGTNYPP